MTSIRCFLTAVSLLGVLSVGGLNSAAEGSAPATATPRKLKVFLLAGQSNMEGKGDGSKLTDDDRRQLGEARKHVQLAYNHEPASPLQLTPSTSGLRRKFGVGETVFGPELFFGLRMAEAWPREQILLIKRSVGATSLAGRWNPEWTLDKADRMLEGNAPPLYPDFLAYVWEILSLYPKDSYEICGMLWVQGESDGDKHRWAGASDEYGDNLRKLIEGMRRETDVPDLPFIMVQVGNGKVTTGMQTVVATMRNVSLIPQSSDPKSPNYFPKYPVGHYNYEGQKRIGNLCADTFLENYGNRGLPRTTSAPVPADGAISGLARR